MRRKGEIMKIFWRCLLLAIALLVAACGDDAGVDAGDGNSGDGDSGDSASGGDGSDGDGTGSDGNGTGDDPPSDTDDPPDDDFGDIIGDPEFDADVLDEDTEAMVDDIAGIVSVGPCTLETMGFGITTPEGWFCRVLDNPIPGFDGFTLLSEASELEITVGSASGFSACDIAGVCSNVMPVEIPGFSDAMVYEIAGLAGGMSGTHDVYELDLVVNHLMPLSADDIQFVADVVATLAPV